MTGAVRVRTADLDDSDAVLAAYEWLFEPPGKRPQDWDRTRAAARLQRALASDRSTVLVADDGETIVGIASVYLDIESIRFGQRAWVEDLAVHPEHRSLGIGKHLLGAAKDWARIHGATRLALDSGEARVDAHRFYARELPSYRAICFGWNLTES